MWQGQEDWHSSHRHYPQPSSLVNSVMGFYYYFNKLFCVRSERLCYLPLDVSLLRERELMILMYSSVPRVP